MAGVTTGRDVWTRLAAVGATLLWCAASSRGQRVPSFSHTAYTLDTLRHGDTVTLAYPFVNTTGDSLIVDDIRTDCGCVSSIDGGNRYGPGDSAAVVVRFASAGQQTDETYEVAVTFRAPTDTARTATATAVLSFTAPIEHEVAFIPPLLCGVHTRRDRPPLLNGVLVNNGSTPLRITAIAADSSSPLQVLTRQLPVQLAAAERLPFVVTLPAATPLHEVRSRISAVIENAEYTEHSCEVYLYLD